MIDQALRALSTDDPSTLAEAIITLGESGDPKAVAPLVRSLLRFESDVELKTLVCDSLGELGDLRSTQALLSQLRDPNEEVRESAFTALLSIGERRANAMPDASSWTQGFADPNEALTQIAWQTDLEAVQLLLRALEEDEREVKIGALYTLGQLGFVGALSQVSKELYNPIDEISAAAAFALGELARLGSKEIVNTVCHTLHHAWSNTALGQETQIQVLRAAAECQPHEEQVKHHLAHLFVSALEHPEHVFRQLAVIGLGRLGDPRAATVLSLRLQDPEVGVRRNAAYAIGALNARESSELLVHYAIDQSSEVRVAIIKSLQRAPRDLALEAVYKALYSADERYRSIAAQLLGGLKDKKGLLKTLQDDDSRVRKNSALAIGAAGLSDLASALTLKLNDPDWRVRAAVAEGLKRLKNPDVIGSLQARHRVESHAVVLGSIEHALLSLSKLLNQSN